jgi:hypothetical protein
MTDPLILELQRRSRERLLGRNQGRGFGPAPSEPLDERSIRSAELLLGQGLPALLRDLYGQVGNGGFGPGYGLLPLVLEDDSSDEETVVKLFTAFRCEDPEDSAWAWPEHLLPFCDWGCAIRSCVDASLPDGAVVTFDPNVRGVGEPMSQALARTHSSLRSWLSDWLAGVALWDLMFEPDPGRAVTGINPFTREPLRHVPNKLRRL